MNDGIGHLKRVRLVPCLNRQHHSRPASKVVYVVLGSPTIDDNHREQDGLPAHSNSGNVAVMPFPACRVKYIPHDSDTCH